MRERFKVIEAPLAELERQSDEQLARSVGAPSTATVERELTGTRYSVAQGMVTITWHEASRPATAQLALFKRQ
jgi:hypothetical protein